MATGAYAAILRDARKSALLRMTAKIGPLRLRRFLLPRLRNQINPERVKHRLILTTGRLAASRRKATRAVILPAPKKARSRG